MILSVKKSKTEKAQSLDCQQRISKNILIRNLRNQFLDVVIEDNMTGLDLKKIVCEIERIDVNHQCMLFNGIAIQNDKKLSEYHMKDKDIVFLVVRTLGGFNMN